VSSDRDSAVVAIVGRQKHSRKRSRVCSAPKECPPCPTSACAPKARLSSSNSTGVNWLEHELQKLAVGRELLKRRHQVSLKPGPLIASTRWHPRETPPGAYSSTRSRPGSQPWGWQSAFLLRSATAGRGGVRSAPTRTTRTPTRGPRRMASRTCMSVLERNDPSRTGRRAARAGSARSQRAPRRVIHPNPYLARKPISAAIE
jgi:hypothetical protein